MKIKLEKYNPRWPNQFESEKLFLSEIIGEYLVGSIEHVGSTAIPGILAKPIIDIMFGVESLEASSGAIETLQHQGYCYYPYKSDVMHWFCKPSPEFRTHHLHLVPYNSLLWQERINFRNMLSNNLKLAQEYSELKRSLANEMAHDREAYTKNKWPFIQKILYGHC